MKPIQVLMDSRTMFLLKALAEKEDRKVSPLCRLLIKEALLKRVKAGELSEAMAVLEARRREKWGIRN